MCTQDFSHKIVGFEEKIIRAYPNKTYYYSDYSRRFIHLKSRSVDRNRKIEVVNGTRILHIGNKTYVLGKASEKSGSLLAKNNVKKYDGYSVISSSFFIHKAYLEMYFDPLMVPNGALEYVERSKKCEGILLNIVVTKFLADTRRDQSGPLAVKNTLSIKRLGPETTPKTGRYLRD